MTTTDGSKEFRVSLPSGDYQVVSAEEISQDHGTAGLLSRHLAVEGVSILKGVYLAERGPDRPGTPQDVVLNGAAVLLERDGVFTWHFGAELAENDFDWHAKKIRLFAVGVDGGKLERNVATRWIKPDADDPEYWEESELPQLSAEPRLLVLVHDVFGSSVGSFGALTQTRKGRKLLSEVSRNYDSVLGFDHPTLTRTPKQNAKELLARLSKWAPNADVQKPPILDIVAHGRGGLVARAFSELVLPAYGWSSILDDHADRFCGRVRSITLVGTPNLGTPLARPDSWPNLLNLYTTLAISRLHVGAPSLDESWEELNGSGAEEAIARGSLGSVGTLVQVLAAPSASRPKLVGLEAMSPESETVRELAGVRPTSTRLRAVTAEFSLAGYLPGGEQGYFEHIAPRLARELEACDLGPGNDIVVPEQSMASLGASGKLLARELGASQTHHLTYFVDGRVVAQVADWLDQKNVGAEDSSFDTSKDNERAASADPDADPGRTAHFRAEMPELVELGKSAEVSVTIAYETLQAAAGGAQAEAAGEIDAHEPILVQLLGRTNFEPALESKTVDPPKPGEPVQLTFEVRPSACGGGEVWVMVRQGVHELVTMMLQSDVVEKIGADEPVGTGVAEPRRTVSGHLEGAILIRVIEQTRADSLQLVYDVSSSELGIRELFESKPIKGDIQTYVNGTYQTIFESYRRNLSAETYDANKFMRELQECGGDLFDELIPEGLQKILWEHWDRLEGILLQSEQPHIPWELLDVKEPGKPISDEPRFLGMKGLTRWRTEEFPTTELRVDYGKAKYVVPDYPEKGRDPRPPNNLPGAHAEIEFVKDRFGAEEVEASSTKVRDLLRKPGSFHLLHFACHGLAETDDIRNARLLMEGHNKGTRYIQDPLSSTTVGQYSNLRAENGSGPIVVLNACEAGRGGQELTSQGGFAQAFLKAGASAFVGALWKVDDHAARVFTENLYDRLQSRAPAWKAVVDARNEAKKLGDHTWIAYTVYAHPLARLKLQGAPAPKVAATKADRQQDPETAPVLTASRGAAPAPPADPSIDRMLAKIDETFEGLGPLTVRTWSTDDVAGAAGAHEGERELVAESRVGLDGKTSLFVSSKTIESKEALLQAHTNAVRAAQEDRRGLLAVCADLVGKLRALGH